MNTNRPVTLMKTNRRRWMSGAATALAGVAWPAWAQTEVWPSKPVNVVVPFPAGGGTDAFARPFSAQFARQTGKQLVIDNRGGAGGTVGAAVAAKASPDGYTLFMGAVHHSIAPAMYPKLSYDIEKDFVPLALLANVPQVLVVNPSKMPGDFRAFLALVKAHPGRYNYGSAGSGTSHHLAGELFKIQTRTFVTHIPYRGAGPALTDLISGNVDMMFDGLGSSAQHIRSGRIKALMVAGAKRNPAFPDVPCAAELGLPDYTVTTWYGLWAPRGTPVAVQHQIVDEVKKIGAAADIKTAWAANGAEFPDITFDKFGQFVSAEVKRWAAVVAASGAKLD